MFEAYPIFSFHTPNIFPSLRINSFPFSVFALHESITIYTIPMMLGTTVSLSLSTSKHGKNSNVAMISVFIVILVCVPHCWGTWLILIYLLLPVHTLQPQQETHIFLSLY